MNYDKRIVDYCKTHNIDLGIQNVFTPIAEIEKATGFSFINEITTDVKNICILFNVEFFEYFIKQDYIKNNNVKIYFGYDCEFDKAVVLDYKYSNIELIDLTAFSQTKDIKELNKAMKNRKFDVVFSNPPYTRNIDLEILQVLFHCGNKIIFIHPSTWAIDKKFKTNLYNNIRNTNYLERIIFLPNGNELFNITNFTPICISIWNINKKNTECYIEDNYYSNVKYKTDINNINIFGDFSNKVIKFKETILDYMKNHNGSIHDNRILSDYSNMTKYSLVYSIIVGSHQKGSGLIKNLSDDFFAMVRYNKNVHYIDNTYRWDDKAKHTGYSNWLIWSFNNIQERENFINYCKTKFTRFCLALLKFGQNIHNGEIKLIPWLDFTRSWTDKDLCKEFNISQELWDYIDKFIPDYYDDYKSGF